MDMFLTSILVFFLIYYVIYQLCFYIYSESVQFIKNEVKYNYDILYQDKDYTNLDNLTEKINELKNDLISINSQIVSQNNILQSLQEQINNI